MMTTTSMKTNHLIKLAIMRHTSSSSSSFSAAVSTSTTTSTSSTTTTAASRLIQRRATTGSVSSIFYLKTLPSGSGPGQKEEARKQAKFIENVFTMSVGVPIAILGLGGIYKISKCSSSELN